MAKEIPLTKGKYAIVDDSDVKLVSQYKWHYHPQGYAATTAGGLKNKHTILMHRLISRAIKGEVVDHANGDKLDNRQSNLRICTQRNNIGNSRIRKDNTTGYKGVTFSKDNKNWVARIFVNGKHTHLGSFDNPHDAARMYNFWAVDLFGEFARLNKIEEVINA